MALRFRYYHFLRTLSLGTSLTALFLLVRCSVPDRDYSLLNIGNPTGGGGDSGSGGDGSGGSSAGQGGLGGTGGLGGLGGLGGQGGSPPVPIPCTEERNDAGTDAGLGDAGLGDAGLDAGGTVVSTNDAGTEWSPCACVDGFIRAIDEDGDGEGTRECLVAPGLDCDDGDGTVTHNSCGGCGELPNAVGDDCLDCGAYVCDGPDSLACATKPDAVVIDPDCRCLDALIVARDTDGDGQGTRLCEQNPGIDCNDGNGGFVTNACGGCDALPGTVGAACNECGVWTCNASGTAECVPSTGAAGQRCLGDNKTRQTCIGTGFWGGDSSCTNVCYQGACEVCTPGTFLCGTDFSGSAILYKCLETATSSSSGINWTSWDSCFGYTCNATTGGCTGYLFLPRDPTFDVAPLLRPGLPWHDILNTASESDYG